MSYSGYLKSNEPDRLRLSDKEASDRFWKKAFNAVFGVLGFATLETLATFFVINDASSLVVFLTALAGVGFFMVSFVWLFNRPKYTVYYLTALDAARVIDLRHRLQHELSRHKLLDWLEEDYPIRTWDMHQLLDWDAKLHLESIR